jgi:hypothetical protein
MKRLFQALFVWLALCPSGALAQDQSARDLQELIRQAQAANPPPPKGEMLIEACVVGRPENFEGYNRVSLYNDFDRDGLVIEYIRSYADGMRADEAQYLRRHRLPIVEGPTALMKRMLIEGRWKQGVQDVSVLRPKETCHLYLPQGSWFVVVTRVPITGAGFQIEAPERCFNAGTGQYVECRIRLDTTGYGVPSKWSGALMSRHGTTIYFDYGDAWTDWVR